MFLFVRDAKEWGLQMKKNKTIFRIVKKDKNIPIKLSNYWKKNEESIVYKICCTVFKLYYDINHKYTVDDFFKIINEKKENKKLYDCIDQLRSIGVVKYFKDDEGVFEIIPWQRHKYKIVPRNFIRFCYSNGIDIKEFNDNFEEKSIFETIKGWFQK